MIIDGYKKISKAEAEERYNNDLVIYLTPSKLKPGRPWQIELGIRREDVNVSFQNLINGFLYSCEGKYGRTVSIWKKEVLQ